MSIGQKVWIRRYGFKFDKAVVIGFGANGKSVTVQKEYDGRVLSVLISNCFERED